MEQYFDPTDSDRSMQLAYAAVDLLIIAGRIMASEESGMRIGRDTASDLSVKVMDVAEKLGILPHQPTAEEVAELFGRLDEPPQEQEK